MLIALLSNDLTLSSRRHLVNRKQLHNQQVNRKLCTASKFIEAINQQAKLSSSIQQQPLSSRVTNDRRNILVLKLYDCNLGHSVPLNKKSKKLKKHLRYFIHGAAASDVRLSRLISHIY